jgi:hypothetical protein
VAVEKVAFLEKLPKVGNRKCPGNPRESFIAHPDAILFSRFFLEGVFQHPLAAGAERTGMLGEIYSAFLATGGIRQHPRTAGAAGEYVPVHGS